jgi:hypothetical protein
MLAEIALLETSPFFDRAYYLARNPDVAASGLDPAAHYLAHGVAENRNPSAEFDNRDYLGRYPDVASGGMNPLLHYIRFGAREGRQPGAGSRHSKIERFSLDGLRATRFKDLRPLRVFTAPAAARRRVTLLTDSINRGSLFGGVGTAIMFAALFAQRLGASLRIATQTEAAEAGSIMALLQANAIPWSENIELAFCDRMAEDDQEIDIRAGDLFITTSWWTTSNALETLSPAQIIYFLQEDERMFYPHGDEHLLASEVLRHAGLRVVVNSQMLHAHLAADGLQHIAQNGLWFEPAFPAAQPLGGATAPLVEKPPGQKHLFFFYARPWNGRNLFIRGMEAISATLEQGILDPQQWDFCFVGRDLEAIMLPCGVTPKLWQNLPWPEYVALVRQVDLGLSLMYTPHPSYPPLDLAASGAVVVTNQCGIKTSLSHYSPNILCVDPSIEGLVAALAQGVALATDLPRRRANQALNRFGTSWQENFAPVFERLVAEMP